jgi:hypothetical protein
VYDVITNSWSTQTLGEAKSSLAAAGAGNKVLFGGGNTATGPTTSVDIFTLSDCSAKAAGR